MPVFWQVISRRVKSLRQASSGIEELDGEVHAFLELTKDAAFEQAAKIDEALANGTFDEMGPLAGVPVAFKDNMNYEGTHTTCSSLMLENYVSPYTATCVAKTIEAGGIPLGKAQHGRIRIRQLHRDLRVRPHQKPVGS